MIHFLTKDLMILSSAQSYARSQGLTLKSCSRIQDLAEPLTQGTSRLVLVDLQMPGLDIVELSNELSKREPQPRVVTFAQHVNVEIIDQAKGLFGEVMTRGQFNKNLPKLIASSNETSV